MGELNINTYRKFNRGRQKCNFPDCTQRSLPGFVLDSGLCKYHFELKFYGRRTADRNLRKAMKESKKKK